MLPTPADRDRHFRLLLAAVLDARTADALGPALLNLIGDLAADAYCTADEFGYHETFADALDACRARIEAALEAE